MKKHYIFVFVLLCIVQLLINNYFNLSQYLLLSLLPLAIFILPVGQNSSIVDLLLAFIVGLLVDFLSSPLIGISSCSLLLLALVKKPLISNLFGEEVICQSLRELILLFSAGCATYFLPYVLIDCAGVRPWPFILIKWLCSSASSALVCCVLSVILFREK